MVTIDKSGRIVKQKKSMKRYVKAKNSIGRFVENLTGITRLDLDRFGLSFANAMKDLKKYCGLAFKKASYITFGNHDMKILGQSISYNLDSPKELCDVIKKNYVDFQAIISEFIRDEKGNPLSLANYLQVFGLQFDGQAHDPEYDATNLARLYDAFMSNSNKVLEEYTKQLNRSSFHPEPVDKVIKKLLKNEPVTPEEFNGYLKDYIE